MANGITGLVALSIDCADPPALARFWQRLVGGQVVDDGGGTELRTEALRFDFLPVPEPKTVKNRLHLDLRSDDYRGAIGQALAAGATLADDVHAGDRWQVLRDPEGNEFCILRPV